MSQESKAPQADPSKLPKIDWDDSNMKSSYANVCNVNGTREEVVLFFGISNPTGLAGDPQVRVQLSDRVILSPFAAKRLAQLLGNVVSAYEQRFGSLEPDPAGQQSVVPTVKN